MKRIFTVIFALLLSISSSYSISISDTLNNEIIKKPKNFYILGFTPSRVKNIYGLAIGPVGSEVFCDKPYTQSIDGIGIQLIGQGIFQIFYIGHHPFKSFYNLKKDSVSAPETDSHLQQIDSVEKRVLYNGLLVSPFGTFSDQINGVTLSAWMSQANYINGISFNLLWNLVMRVNGLSIGFVNDQLILNGVQIGLINRTCDIKGFQIGLWNKNRIRSLPIINWNFKK